MLKGAKVAFKITVSAKAQFLSGLDWDINYADVTTNRRNKLLNKRNIETDPMHSSKEKNELRTVKFATAKASTSQSRKKLFPNPSEVCFIMFCIYY